MVYSSLLVGCKEHAAWLEERLTRELGPLAVKGLLLEAERFRRGHLTFFRAGLSGRRSQEAARLLRGAVAEAVADHILGPLLAARVSRTVARGYPEFGCQEVERVAAAVIGRLGATLAAAREETRAQIEEWLARHPKLTVEGFLRFRLGGLFRSLASLLHRAAEEVLLEKEEAGFVALVKSNVESAPGKLAADHVFGHERGYVLAGEGGYALDLPSLLGLARDGTASLGDEDALLAGLFWLNPDRVVLHGAELPQPSRRVLVAVFGPRMERCVCCQGRQASGQARDAGS